MRENDVRRKARKEGRDNNLCKSLAFPLPSKLPFSSRLLPCCSSCALDACFSSSPVGLSVAYHTVSFIHLHLPPEEVVRRTVTLTVQRSYSAQACSLCLDATDRSTLTITHALSLSCSLCLTCSSHLHLTTEGLLPAASTTLES